MTVMRSVVLGCGSYLPERVLTNAEIAKSVDTTDEWIVQRTGIRERHIAAEGEFTSHLGLKAAERALAAAGVDAQSIDLIVLATSTPDNTFPASAVSIQAALGITHGVAFDLQAVCSGFVFALATADNFLRSARTSARLSSAPKPSRASSTGTTAPHAFCSATGRGRWFLRRKPSPERSRTAAF